MIGATIFLVVVIALVTKMVWDVQMVKIDRFFKEIERFQILAGIKSLDKKGKRKAYNKVTDPNRVPGVDIEGIEELSDRFQKLAHIKESK
jgi:hypothetical protein